MESTFSRASVSIETKPVLQSAQPLRSKSLKPQQQNGSYSRQNLRNQHHIENSETALSSPLIMRRKLQHQQQLPLVVPMFNNHDELNMIRKSHTRQQEEMRREIEKRSRSIREQKTPNLSTARQCLNKWLDQQRQNEHIRHESFHEESIDHILRPSRLNLQKANTKRTSSVNLMFEQHERQKRETMLTTTLLRKQIHHAHNINDQRDTTNGSHCSGDSNITKMYSQLSKRDKQPDNTKEAHRHDLDFRGSSAIMVSKKIMETNGELKELEKALLTMNKMLFNLSVASSDHNRADFSTSGVDLTGPPNQHKQSSSISFSPSISSVHFSDEQLKHLATSSATITGTNSISTNGVMSLSKRFKKLLATTSSAKAGDEPTFETNSTSRGTCRTFSSHRSPHLFFLAPLFSSLRSKSKRIE